MLLILIIGGFGDCYGFTVVKVRQRIVTAPEGGKLNWFRDNYLSYMCIPILILCYVSQLTLFRMGGGGGHKKSPLPVFPL